MSAILGTSLASAAPPDSDSDLAPAWRAYREGRAVEAREALAAQPTQTRQSPSGLLLGGLLQLEDGNAEGAARTFARVPLAGPLGLAARYNQTLALLQAERLDDAVRTARALVDALPSLPKSRHEAAGAALYNMAMAMLAHGHTRSARRIFGLIAERLPETAAAKSATSMLEAKGAKEAPPIQRCVGSYRAKEYREARACFTQLVEAHGPSAEVLYAIAYSDYQLGEYTRAAAEFERALVASPKDGDAIFMLAMARAHMGQHQIALDLFRDALEIGLTTEDPAEARRHIRTLSRLLAQRLRKGWVFDADVSAGYDSNPRPTGGAAAASTSYGTEPEGSGFAFADLDFEHRWPHSTRPGQRLGGLTAAGYRLTQYLLFSDLASTVSPGPGIHSRWQDTFSDMSLQTHTAYLYSRIPHGAWTGRLHASGSVELSGLRDFGPLLAAAYASPELEYAWNRRTTSHLAAGYSPQTALDEDLDYLSGHGLFAEVSQSARWGSAVEVSVSYRVAAWWLGTFAQSATECTGEEPCALTVPYSNHLHRPSLSVDLTSSSGLALGGELALERRVYWDESLYRLSTGVQVAEERRDLAVSAAAVARIPAGKNLRFVIEAEYTHNRSTIDEETTGIEEGFDRFAISAGLSYRK